jgi:pSer/pThr/pTyr-binding forkhead associated (FHA) protein
VPDSLLTILKFCFLALLYLFFFRVLRAVWVEVSGKAPTARATAPATGVPQFSGNRSSNRKAAVGGGKAPGKLKVVEPAEARGRTYDLVDELTMGRASGCHITLDDDTYVSQLHARVFRRDGQLFVEDLGSTNGTYVNRTKVTAPLAVRRGDRLQVGKTVMEVV